MEKYTGTAMDFQGVREYSYPKSSEDIPKVRLPFDLLMTKNKTWYYMWSHDQIPGLLKDDARKEIIRKGEHYMIVNSISGEIYKQG